MAVAVAGPVVLAVVAFAGSSACHTGLAVSAFGAAFVVAVVVVEAAGFGTVVLTAGAAFAGTVVSAVAAGAATGSAPAIVAAMTRPLARKAAKAEMHMGFIFFTDVLPPNWLQIEIRENVSDEKTAK